MLVSGPSALRSCSTRPLPEELAGLIRPDPSLFWSIKPNLEIEYFGQLVRTNSLGLRSPRVSKKASGEFRILSLGESSTFGTGVANGETYSDLLEDYLQQADPARRFRVLNAGTPAHSSFQMLNYLRERSPKLEPDMVLLYSELNDYLPTSLRDSRHNEVGVTMTDRELSASQRSSARRWLEAHSAFFRAVIYARARSSIERFKANKGLSPLRAIGMPGLVLERRLFEKAGPDTRPTPIDIQEHRLPSRVSPEERLDNLRSIAAFCAKHHIRLLIIHPSYTDSKRHRCLLTHFCANEGISMVEAQDFLHPAGMQAGIMFLDAFHPSRRGHANLAKGLAARILDELASDPR